MMNLFINEVRKELILIDPSREIGHRKIARAYADSSGNGWKFETWGFSIFPKMELDRTGRADIQTLFEARNLLKEIARDKVEIFEHLAKKRHI
ncbi:MAG: hypothetical protein ACO3LE_10400 [Bdellovibrionota bacterium]